MEMFDTNLRDYFRQSPITKGLLEIGNEVYAVNRYRGEPFVVKIVSIYEKFFVAITVLQELYIFDYEDIGWRWGFTEDFVDLFHYIDCSSVRKEVQEEIFEKAIKEECLLY